MELLGSEIERENKRERERKRKRERERKSERQRPKMCSSAVIFAR